MPLPPDRLRDIFQFDERDPTQRGSLAPSYRALRDRLDAANFDAEVAASCREGYRPGTGRPALPPGWFYRIVFAAFLEGHHTHRSAARLVRTNPVVREFVGIPPARPVPHHSTLGAFRARVPEATHAANFALLWRIVRDVWENRDPAPT